MDTLLCSGKEEAHKYIDSIGSRYIEDWEFLDDGKVRLILLDGWKEGVEK